MAARNSILKAEVKRRSDVEGRLLRAEGCLSITQTLLRQQRHTAKEPSTACQSTQTDDHHLERQSPMFASEATQSIVTPTVSAGTQTVFGTTGRSQPQKNELPFHGTFGGLAWFAQRRQKHECSQHPVFDRARRCRSYGLPLAQSPTH